MSRWKNALAALACGLVGDIIFVVWPLLNAKSGKSFTYWGGFFAASVGITFMGLAFLLFGKRAEEFLAVRDMNNIGGKKAIGLVVMAVVAMAAFIAFEWYLEKLGYQMKPLW